MVRIAKQEELPFLAAAIAYYGFVSVIPGIIIAISVASYLGIEPLLSRFIEATQSHLSQTAQDSVINAIQHGNGQGGMTLLGGAFLFWATLRVFRGIDTAFSRIYGTSASNQFRKFLDAIIVVFAVGLGLIIMVTVGAFLATSSLTGSSNVVSFLVLLGGLFIVFLPFYYVFPNQPVAVIDILPGTLFAAVSWVVLQMGFQLYTRTATQFELNGVLGAALLLVTWFYFAAMAILFGAIINYTQQSARKPI
jgi:YihY family inner membrane protein